MRHAERVYALIHLCARLCGLGLEVWVSALHRQLSGYYVSVALDFRPMHFSVES